MLSHTLTAGPDLVFLSCRDWRTNIAHLVKNVDPISGMPLAARVCIDHGGLEYNAQAADFSDIVTYMAHGLPGPWLAALCSFMWIVKVINEIGCTLRVTVAVARLRGPKTKIITGGKLESVTMPRIVWFTLVQMTRLAVACTLAVTGTIFLCHTVELPEVILNCVALSFVMDVCAFSHTRTHVSIYTYKHTLWRSMRKFLRPSARCG